MHDSLENPLIKEKCPICKKINNVNYLGVILENDLINSNQLFVCKNRKTHNRYIYFTKNKSNNFIDFVNLPEDKKERDISIKTLLNKRVYCPKHEEHEDKRKDHEYIFVVSLGSDKNRFYCRKHLNRSYHNRYEFIYPKKKVTQITLESQLKNISEKYYNKLNKIYKSRNKYDLDFDKDMILESLLTIGLSDSLIASIFKVNQSTISRNKKNKKFKRILKIKTLKVSTKFPFYTKIRSLNHDDLNTIYKYLDKSRLI